MKSIRECRNTKTPFSKASEAIAAGPFFEFEISNLRFQIPIAGPAAFSSSVWSL
jgi:hypothetical protein